MQHHGQSPRKGKQQWLAEALERFGALAPLRRLHDRGRTPVLILAYHRIAASAPGGAYPLDLGLISATAAEFEAQMRALRELATPVSLDRIADAVTHGRTLPDRPVAVTFDDGFRDTFETALPVLARHEIPATVFVSTAYIAGGDPFWFETVAHLMMRVPPRSVQLDELPDGLPVADTEAARRAAIGELHGVLKTCANPRRDTLVREWRERFDRFLDTRALDLGRSIDEAQVLGMARAGIDFGSHTVSHPNLALAEDGAIQREFAASKAKLESLLGRPVRSLAYPFGTPDTYDARAFAAARACGYELAVSYRQGVNWLGALNALELRRLGISPGISPAKFRAMLALPAWLHPHFPDGH
jgi:peptidoglycan/xylan/chitin deacetylase (PgdA/CDA1 family)